MPRTIAILSIVAALSGCETPADRDPALFEPSDFAAASPWPQLLPLGELAAPPGTDAAALAALEADARALAIRAEALEARARLASGELLTAEERARLLAAAARWTGA